MSDPITEQDVQDVTQGTPAILLYQLLNASKIYSFLFAKTTINGIKGINLQGVVMSKYDAQCASMSNAQLNFSHK